MSDTDPATKVQRGGWRKGQSGNPRGRPAGVRNRATIAVEALLDGEAESLTRKAVDLALEGDTIALRLCLDRIAPPRRDRLVTFDAPTMNGVQDAPRVIRALLAATASGAITAGEAESVARLVELYRRTVETAELDARVAALESSRGS